MQVRRGMRIAAVVALVALPFGVPVERAADAAVARHDPPPGAARPAAAFSARWPNGAAIMSTNSARVLVTYSIVCVTHPKNNTVAQRAEGWGYMLYNWKTHKIDHGPIDVFKPHGNGAAIAASKNFG